MTGGSLGVLTPRLRFADLCLNAAAQGLRQPTTIASFAAAGANGRMSVPAFVMVTKLDGGIACQSPPSRSKGSETMQRPARLAKAPV